MTVDVTIVHRGITEYRLPLFERLEDSYDVTVVFLTNDSMSQVASALDGRSFDWRVLPTCSVVDTVAATRDTDPDVVIIADAPELVVTNAALAVVLSAEQVPLVVWTETIKSGDGMTICDNRFQTHAKRFMIQTLRDCIYRRATVLFGYSELARKYLLSRGIDGNRIVSGPQVMPVECLTERPSSISKQEDKITVLSLGYLRPLKGIDVLIDAYERVRGPTTELVIAGSGNARGDLEQKASITADIKFVGYVGRDKRERCYRNADVFVLPTRYDAWGMVVNEAIYYGLPVITTTMAGASELIDRHNVGEVVPSDDVVALSGALGRLISDDQRRLQYARRSLHTTEICDVDTGTRPFHTAIERALEWKRL